MVLWHFGWSDYVVECFTLLHAFEGRPGLPCPPLRPQTGSHDDTMTDVHLCFLHCKNENAQIETQISQNSDFRRSRNSEAVRRRRRPVPVRCVGR